MGTTAYLNDDSEERAKNIKKAGEFRSISEVVRQGLKLLEEKQREMRLAKKYRRETPVSDEIIGAQAETLGDLDG